MATPNLEGWMLCLLGHHGTDEWSPGRAERELAAAHVPAKSTRDFVELARTRPLPTTACSLKAWLDDAEATLDRLIDGMPGTR